MKRFFSFMLLCIVGAVFSLLVSCDGKIQKVRSKWNYDFNSYSGLVEAKDGLLKTKPWDKELFDTLVAMTYSNQNYGLIDYNEAFNIYDAVFKGGAHMVLIAVDSTMKTSVYNNLGYWENLSSQIANKTDEYQKIYGALESPNENLREVDNMIKEYYSVLSLSKSTFGQTPRCISRYTGNYGPIEAKIKNNKYWNTYFCNNSEIKRGINEFPQRVKAAQFRYYKDLKDQIIQRAMDENITKEQLANAVNRYQTITSIREQSLRDDLGEFLMRYQNDESQQVSVNRFWK